MYLTKNCESLGENNRQRKMPCADNNADILRGTMSFWKQRDHDKLDF